ncbi:MAG: RHS repeat-associated core domain-containing protein [Planctomycetes bacterium]|nr:RHS repeat-associated core domain-containing protein [Planctomycetota bacterium]
MHTGASDSPFTFVGKQSYYRDQEVDLYFAGARYYDALTGRWLSEDPMRFEAGDENLYRYVGNNPLLDVDPSGRQPQMRFIAEGGGSKADQARQPEEAVLADIQFADPIELNVDLTRVSADRIQELIDRRLAVAYSRDHRGVFTQAMKERSYAPRADVVVVGAEDGQKILFVKRDDYPGGHPQFRVLVGKDGKTRLGPTTYTRLRYAKTVYFDQNPSPKLKRSQVL